MIEPALDDEGPEKDGSSLSSDDSRRRLGRADKAAFAKRLGQLVHGKGIRQADLARRSDLAPHLISTYMLGKAIPGKVNVIKLAKALNVSADTLLPEPTDDVDTLTSGSPMMLAVNSSDPSMATLRINMQVKTEIGSEVIKLLLRDREAKA